MPPSQVNLQSDMSSLSIMQFEWNRKSLNSLIPAFPSGFYEISSSIITVVFKLSFKTDIPFGVISFLDMFSFVKI